jgi:predicted O-methyltransferase YrrM
MNATDSSPTAVPRQPVDARRSERIERSLAAHRWALPVTGAIARRNLCRLVAEGLPATLSFPLRFLVERRLDEAALAVVVAVEALRDELAARGDEPLAVLADPSRPLRPELLTAAVAARVSAVQPLWGAFLHLCAAARGARNVLELGGGVGISGAYLATAPAVRRFITVEGSPERAAWAARNLARVAPHAEVVAAPFAVAIDAVLGRFDEGIDLLFLDGPKRRDVEAELVARIAPRLNPGALVLCDDIHWSREMERAWREIELRIGFEWAVDAGRMGVALWRGGGARARTARLFSFAGVDPFRLRRLARELSGR